MTTFAYTFPNQIAPVPIKASSLVAAVNAVRDEMWDTRAQVDAARIYRLAAFIDERVAR